jgi:hypothetical protein
VEEEVPGMEDGLRMERQRSPRESRESLRQVRRAQGEVRKPKCQRRHYSPGVQRLKTYERLCAYLHEITNTKHTETRPQLANTWKCRGY